MPSPYLLDTTVLRHWTRNSPEAQAIDANFQLSSSAMWPLICEVSLGEMLAFSLSRNWGPQKLRRLKEIERQVVVHISDSRVRQAYAELSTLAQSSGWSLFHGKNDLWAGAALPDAVAPREPPGAGRRAPRLLPSSHVAAVALHLARICPSLGLLRCHEILPPCLRGHPRVRPVSRLEREQRVSRRLRRALFV